MNADNTEDCSSDAHLHLSAAKQVLCLKITRRGVLSESAAGLGGAFEPQESPQSGTRCPSTGWTAPRPELETGVSWGVPWARGTVRREQTFALTAADGKSLPLQTWPLAYWPDGSIKFIGFATVTAATRAVPPRSGRARRRAHREGRTDGAGHRHRHRQVAVPHSATGPPSLDRLPSTDDRRPRRSPETARWMLHASDDRLAEFTSADPEGHRGADGPGARRRQDRRRSQERRRASGCRSWCACTSTRARSRSAWCTPSSSTAITRRTSSRGSASPSPCRCASRCTIATCDSRARATASGPNRCSR